MINSETMNAEAKANDIEAKATNVEPNEAEDKAKAIKLDASIDDEKPIRSISMLTTIDNPYDYFTQFDEWFAFDNEKQSKLDLPNNCCGYLDRVIAQLGGISDDMTEIEENQMIEKAIDQIIALNPFHIYKKVTKQVAAE